MKILGIDPGYDRCGFAILDCVNGRKPVLLNFGIIKTQRTENFVFRLDEIATDIESLLEIHKPDVLSIEDLFFVQNVTTGMKVAQVRGVIMYLGYKHGAQIVDPKPVEIKSSFAGDGKADKKQMQQMAQIMFGLKDQPHIDDAADAIGAAYWASLLR